LRNPQGEIESGALVRFRLRPDTASVFVDDTPNISQSHACALEIVLTVKALEDAEQFVHVSHVEANTIIADEEHLFAVYPYLAHLDNSTFLAAGELDGVRQQVDKHQFDQTRVTLHRRQLPDFPFNLPSFRFRFEVSKNCLNQQIELRWLLSQGLPPNSAQVQQIIYQLSHFLNTLLNVSQALLGSGVHSGAKSSTCEKPLMWRKGARKSCETE